MLPTQLPFYYKSNYDEDNGGFPSSLPFELCFDEKLKMYRQKASIELEDTLRRVYELGSLVDGSISNESGIVYVSEISQFIKEVLEDFLYPKVLEIGCGNGIILKSLRDTKASLLGLEPGVHGKIGGLDGIDIIQDFFPSKKLQGRFDVIISLLVLEHVGDPISFLKSQASFLVENGKIIIGVPNCETFLETGDISIFIHEHYSYFTRESIFETVSRAGLFIERLMVIEGMLVVVTGKKNILHLEFKDLYKLDKSRFETTIERLNSRIQELCNSFEQNDIAVYVPGRALNTFFLANILNCRLVDDNREIHGKYLPCFTQPIESFSDIAKNPPKCILIYSRTFGLRIKEKCIKAPELSLTNILLIEDLD